MPADQPEALAQEPVVAPAAEAGPPTADRAPTPPPHLGEWDGEESIAAQGLPLTEEEQTLPRVPHPFDDLSPPSTDGREAPVFETVCEACRYEPCSAEHYARVTGVSPESFDRVLSVYRRVRSARLARHTAPTRTIRVEHGSVALAPYAHAHLGGGTKRGDEYFVGSVLRVSRDDADRFERAGVAVVLEAP
jgi:hypothetical protein